MRNTEANASDIINLQLEEIELTPSKKVKVMFQFLYNPEYLLKDGNLIINENNLKAFGRIIEPLYDTIEKYSANQSLLNVKHSKRKASTHSSQERSINFFASSSLVNIVDESIPVIKRTVNDFNEDAQQQLSSSEECTTYISSGDPPVATSQSAIPGRTMFMTAAKQTINVNKGGKR